MHNLVVVYTTDQYLIRKYAEIAPIGYLPPPTMPPPLFVVSHDFVFNERRCTRYKSDKRAQ